MHNYIKDEGGPLGIGLQGRIPNRLELRRLRAFVVNVEGKVAARPRQVRSGKTNESEPSMTCRELYQQRRNRAGGLARDEAQRKPVDWLGGVRHEGGVSPDQALMWNVGTCRSDAKRRAQAESLCKGASIDAEHRDGVARSSVEAGESRRSEGATSFGCVDGSTACGRNS